MAVLKNKYVLSKKSHCCDWCNEEIPEDTIYFYNVSVWEGEFACIKLHRECQEAFGQTPAHLLQEGWETGEFKRGQPGSGYLFA